MAQNPILTSSVLAGLFRRKQGNEENLSTKQPQEGKVPRIPLAHGDQRRTRRIGVTKGARAQAPYCLNNPRGDVVL